MNDIADQGYVLHTYRYRESSAIVDLFLAQHGRVSVVAKGVKKPKSSLKAVLQPFLKLDIHAKGKSSLKTIVQADTIAAPIALENILLVSAMYLNELLVRLLPKEEHVPQLFAAYEHVLLEMNPQNLPCLLRQFEKLLIETLGYELPLKCVAHTHDRLVPNALYYYAPEQGFLPYHAGSLAAEPAIFTGAILKAIDDNDFSKADVLKAAKQLFRQVLDPLLGNKPLTSRAIIKAMVEK